MLPITCALMQRHQLHHPLVVRQQALAPDLDGLKRHLQHLTGDGRLVVERSDALNVGLVEAFEVNGGVVVGHGGSFLDRCVADHSKPP